MKDIGSIRDKKYLLMEENVQGITDCITVHENQYLSMVIMKGRIV
jgi:hypothetical protein